MMRRVVGLGLRAGWRVGLLRCGRVGGGEVGVAEHPLTQRPGGGGRSRAMGGRPPRDRAEARLPLRALACARAEARGRLAVQRGRLSGRSNGRASGRASGRSHGLSKGEAVKRRSSGRSSGAAKRRSLNRTVSALASAILPMLNALFLVLIMVAICARPLPPRPRPRLPTHPPPPRPPFPPSPASMHNASVRQGIGRRRAADPPPSSWSRSWASSHTAAAASQGCGIAPARPHRGNCVRQWHC